MAYARGICPVCGREISVYKNGNVLREHHGTEKNDWGHTRYCEGTNQQPNEITKTQEEAAAEAEEKREKKSALFQDIPDAAKQRLSQAIMDFDEPEICADGRRRFLQEHGLPLPPQKITVRTDLRIVVPPSALDRYGSAKVSYLAKVQDRLNEIMGDEAEVLQIW